MRDVGRIRSPMHIIEFILDIAVGNLILKKLK